MKKYLLIIITCLFLINNSFAQLHNFEKENSIFVSGAASMLSLIDKSISNEKYSGTLTSIEFGWQRSEEKWVNSHRIKFTSGDTKSYSIIADIINFELYNDFSYKVNEFSFFKFNSVISLGPSTSFFLHYRDEIISEYSLMTQSFIGSFAAAVNLAWDIKFTNKIYGGLFFRNDLLSISTVLNNNEKGLKMKLLFPTSALNLSFEPYLGCKISKRFSLNLSYIFHYYRNNYWKQFKLADDNLQLTIQYRWNK